MRLRRISRTNAPDSPRPAADGHDHTAHRKAGASSEPASASAAPGWTSTVRPLAGAPGPRGTWSRQEPRETAPADALRVTSGGTRGVAGSWVSAAGSGRGVASAGRGWSVVPAGRGRVLPGRAASDGLCVASGGVRGVGCRGVAGPWVSAAGSGRDVAPAGRGWSAVPAGRGPVLPGRAASGGLLASGGVRGVGCHGVAGPWVSAAGSGRDVAPGGRGRSAVPAGRGPVLAGRTASDGLWAASGGDHAVGHLGTDVPADGCVRAVGHRAVEVPVGSVVGPWASAADLGWGPSRPGRVPAAVAVQEVRVR